MIKIKNGRNASIKFLRTGNSVSTEKIMNRNDAIIKELFSRTQVGAIKGFYLVSDTEFKAYHRSPKNPGMIQLSVGFYRDGELIPTYDVQMQTATDAIREGVTSGIYQLIA